MIGQFFTLTPERVLDAVEHAGHPTTGRCSALNSLENRVYDVELDDGRRVVAKFYRPGRWSREAILGEHELLRRLDEAEVPVCRPWAFPDGATLHDTPDGIHFTLFPRVGGRSAEDLGEDDLVELGRLLGRIHNVSAGVALPGRPPLLPSTYGTDALATILAKAPPPPALRQRYADTVARIVAIAERRFAGARTIALHADCHRGNLLRGPSGWFFLDFDDATVGPPVQDLWLLLPARPADCPRELDALLRGYESFRPFERGSLRLIEPLRALRYVRYAAWIASRWEDPSFVRAFPDFGTERYWSEKITDLYEQLRLLEEEERGGPWA